MSYQKKQPVCQCIPGTVNAEKLDWIEAHLVDATKVASELNVTPADILGLSALESKWGMSRFAIQGNNLFGLQCPAVLGTGCLQALRDPTVEESTFASYADSAESFRLGYGSIIQNVADPFQFASDLQNSGKFGFIKMGLRLQIMSEM